MYTGLIKLGVLAAVKADSKTVIGKIILTGYRVDNLAWEKWKLLRNSVIQKPQSVG